jgi:cytochrome c biogenesis protein CcmG, thiol:disulfide interchange protein DsbE
VPAEASVAEPAPEPTAPDGAERGTLRWVVRGLAILAAAAFIALLAYGIVTKSANTTIDDSLARSKAAPAPNFTLDVLQQGNGDNPKVAAAMADGKLSLKELRGSPVVLNFWASWCIPCRDESPNLQRTWDAERRNGVVVLGLDQQDITSDARDFIKRFALTYPMVRDGGDSTAHRYGTTGIPETYFISGQGKVVGHVIGAISPLAARSYVAAAKAGEPRPAHAGGARKKN